MKYFFTQEHFIGTNRNSIVLNSPLKVTTPSQNGTAITNKPITRGKVYWEILVTGSGAYTSYIGVYKKIDPTTNYSSSNANWCICYADRGTIYSPIMNNTSYGSTFTTNDLMGVVYDADNAKIQFYKNGVPQGEIDTGFAPNEELYIGYMTYYSATAEFNFGQTEFKYPIPDGAKAVDPVIVNKSFVLHNGGYKKWKPAPSNVGSTNVIPTLTSNTGSNGEAIAINEFDTTTYPAWKAFDGNDGTNWAQNTSGGGWIGYKFNQPIRIVKYEMIAQRSKDWQFEASNDGLVWDILHQSSVTSANTSLMSFEFKNNKEYTYYRVNTLTTFQYGTNMHTLKMYEGVDVEPAHWETVTSTPPTLNQFKEKGMDDLSVFDRAVTTLESMPMTDKSEILGQAREGKVFSTTIDLKKYFDIRNIRVEVN